MLVRARASVSFARRLAAFSLAGVLAAVGLVAAAPASTAAEDRTISGSFTIPASGIESWWAEALFIYATDLNGGNYKAATIDPASKTFSISGLARGTYTVHFDASTMDSDGDGYWESSNLLGDTLSPVNVTGANASGIVLNYTAGRTVSGTVSLAAGAPEAWKDMLEATVSIPGPEGCECGDGLVAKVNPSTGAYIIRGLPAKALSVSFGPKYGSTVNLIREYYPNSYSWAGSVPVDFTNGNATNIDATLEVGRTIEGTVSIPAGVDDKFLDAINVEAAGANGAFASTEVNAAGAYRFYGLAPSSYKLKFQAGDTWNADYSAVNYTPLASRYYGGAYTEATASSVNVATTSQTGIDQALIIGRTISGTVTLGAGADTAWKPYLSVYAESGESFRGAKANPVSGAYTITGLPPLAYTVQFEASGLKVGSDYPSSPFAFEYYNNQRSPLAAGSVSVVSGNQTGIDAVLDVQVGNRDFWVTPVPTITGTAAAGSTLTAKPGKWEPYSLDFTYQWKRDGANIVGSTASTYAVTQADAGHNITVVVTSARSGYNQVTKTSAPTAIPATAFTTAPTPTITGTPAAGQVLTAVPGAWSPAATFTYQWLRSGSVIAGATSSTYTVTQADAVKNVSVTVTGSATGYATTAKTSAAVTVVASPFGTAPTPTITGTPVAGQVLTAVPGAWSPAATYTYQWLRNGTTIANANAATYTVTQTDALQNLSVTVTGAATGYVTTPKTSAAVTVAATPFATAPTPTISGTPQTGRSLSVDPGTWSPAANLAIQWLRNGTPIGGATNASYLLAASDVGSTITVSVTGSLSGYASATKTSAGVTAVAGEYFQTAKPGITGTSQVGQTLTATPGVWSPAAAFTYQWQRDGAAIPGATSVSYALQPEDGGAEISVAVTGTTAGYAAATRVSDAVTPLGANFDTAAVPTISGDLIVGKTLTATVAEWTPSAAITLQWRRDGSPIDGATSSTYVLTPADAGHTISVAATGNRLGYNKASTASAETAVIAKGTFAAVPVPTISGSGYAGATLTAKPGVWSPVAAFTYQWKRNGVAIAGATKVTYKLTSADSAKKITVTVTGSAAGYNTVVKTSAALTLSKFFTTSGTASITGTVKVGSTVKASVGTWSPVPTAYSYRWLRDGVAIANATGSSYKVSAADAGKKLTVTVTGKRSGYASTPKTSAAKTVALGTFTTAATPKISGTVKVNSTLTVVRGTWSPTPSSYTYQWYRSGYVITGATGSTYKLVSADKGKTITVKVTAKKTGYSSTAKLSAKTVAVK